MYEKTCIRCGSSIPFEELICPVCRRVIDTPEGVAQLGRRAAIQTRIATVVLVAAIAGYLLAGPVGN